MTHSIQYFRYTYDDFLDEFLNYNYMMEKYLSEQYSNKRRSSVQDTEISDLNHRDFLKFAKDHYEYGTFYPQSYRKSFFTQIFSILEYELKEICMIYHQENKTDFTIHDLKGNSEIEKAKLFLKKASRIDFTSLEPEWSYLNTIRKIRNIFVHHQGEIHKNHNDWKVIKLFIENKKHLIGFSNAAEFLDKESFNELIDDDSIFNIEISDSKINVELIASIKTFLRNLVLQLDVKRELDSADLKSAPTKT